MVIKIRNFPKPLFFRNLVCFIDGLCVINDHPEFDKSYTDICRSELTLKNENMLTFKA